MKILVDGLPDEVGGVGTLIMDLILSIEKRYNVMFFF